jgi:hypothetical protein
MNRKSEASVAVSAYRCLFPSIPLISRWLPVGKEQELIKQQNCTSARDLVVTETTTQQPRYPQPRVGTSLHVLEQAGLRPSQDGDPASWVSEHRPATLLWNISRCGLPTFRGLERGVSSDSDLLDWFEVLTVVALKSSIFWNTSCSTVKINQRFGRPHRLYLHGLRVSQARNQSLLVACFMLVSYLAYSPILKMVAMLIRNFGWFSPDYTALYHGN